MECCKNDELKGMKQEMSLLYVNENDAAIGIEANRFFVRYKDGLKRSVPAETLESITILGHAQITTQCVQECLKRGIPVLFLSKGGSYFGRMESTGHTNPQRQRMQCKLYDTDFAVNLAKKIINAKLKNQNVLLKRYAKGRELLVEEESKAIRICTLKVLEGKKIPELIGYEGQGAKSYFAGLSKLVEEDFVFKGRNRRPPLDRFNSMLSLGYSVLLNELYGKIESKGLNPYFGFVHRDHEKHPTLASDLMEEWRAVIVDATVMSLINGHEIHKEDFYTLSDEPGIFLTKEGIKIFLNKLEKKMQTEARYLNYIDYAVSFRRGIVLQVNQLVHAIEQEDANQYHPIIIR